MTTNEELDRLRLAAEDAAGGPPSAEQVDALIDLVDALEARLAALTTPQEGDAHARVAQVVSDALDAELPEDQRTGEPTVIDENVATALMAAFPVLGRDIAGEIEAVANAQDDDYAEEVAYARGLRRAAEIVRNWR